MWLFQAWKGIRSDAGFRIKVSCTTSNILAMKMYIDSNLSIQNRFVVFSVIINKKV